jgi:hypothetical protein
MGNKNSDSIVENFGRFKTIIQFCEGFGLKYNPINPKLVLENMNLKLETAKQLHDEFKAAEVATINPINSRQDLIKELVKRMRKVKNAVFSMELSIEYKKDVKNLVNRFTGDKVRRKRIVKGKIVRKKRSNSQLDIDHRMETFGLLLELLKKEAGYAPNELILKTDALDDAAERLESLTNEINNANAIAFNKRIVRDKALYLEDDGLVDVSLKCKKYVRAVYGARSDEARMVSAIKLKRFMKISK